MNRNVNRNFAFGLVILRTQRGAALGGHRGLEHDARSSVIDDADARSRTGWAAGRRSRNSCTRAMLADEAVGPDTPHPSGSDGRAARDPLRSTRPVRRAPRLVGRRRVGGRCSLVALPLAPAGPGRAVSAGGFILDDLESARAKALLEAELGAAAVGARRRLLSSPTLEAGTPAFEAAAAEAMRDVAGAPHVARVVSAPARAAPGLGRPPHRLRHRLPGPARRTTRPTPCRSSASASARRPASTSSWPAARPSTATSRRSPRPTSSAASSSPCRSRRSRCSSSSGRSSRPACRSSSVARRSLVALAGDLRRRLASCR